MCIILNNYVRYLNDVRYTVPETDNHHPAERAKIACAYYTIQHEGGHHIDFAQVSIYPGQITANNCKTAFQLTCSRER